MCFPLLVLNLRLLEWAAQPRDVRIDAMHTSCARAAERCKGYAKRCAARQRQAARGSRAWCADRLHCGEGASLVRDAPPTSEASDFGESEAARFAYRVLLGLR